MIHKVYKVFLASPSDVNPERDLARKVVNDTNIDLGRKFNIHLDLVGWEDVHSQYGRPQETINQYLVKCDLFLGLLWKKFGSPSGKEALTGFQEEYELACSMKESEDIDEVKLFFKEIGEDLMDDVGPQLKKVLKFKQKITKSKTILYQPFKDEHEWEHLLGKNLRDYVLSKIDFQEPQPTSPPVPVATIDKLKSDAEQKTSEDNTQVINSLEEALKFFSEGDEFKSSTKARLFLYSSAMFYGGSLRTEVLKTHEIQYIYQLRTKIEPIRVEKLLILRTVIEDKNSVNAGWFFIDIQDNETIDLLLLHLSLNDRSENIRLQALAYIQRLSNFSYLNRLIEKFDDFSVSEQEAIIDIIFKFYDNGTIVTLDLIIENNRTTKIIIAAWIAKVKILLREDEKAAIQLIKSTPRDKRSKSTEYVNELLSISDKILLKELIDDYDSRLRLEIINHIPELYTVEELREILEFPIRTKLPSSDRSLDNNFKIRATAMLELVKREEVTDINFIREKLLDKKVKETKPSGLLPDLVELDRKEYINTILKEFYKTKTYQELDLEIDWTASEGNLIYESLIEKYYDDFKDTLHQDIQEDFIRIKEKNISWITEERDKLLADYPGNSLDITNQFKEYIDRLEEFDKFRKTEYLHSSLTTLSKINRTLPIGISRNILKKEMGYYKHEIIVSLMDSFLENGTIKDIQSIRNLLEDDKLPDNVAIKVYKVLFKLDKDNKHLTLEFLLDTGNPVLLKTLFSIMSITPKESILNTIKSLLYHDKDTVREVAISYLLRTMDDDELAELLDNYPTQNSTYYYNVVCWLDRCIYAPDELKEHFRDELKTKLA